jgi:hypothetical protein
VINPAFSRRTSCGNEEITASVEEITSLADSLEAWLGICRIYFRRSDSGQFLNKAPERYTDSNNDQSSLLVVQLIESDI